MGIQGRWQVTPDELEPPQKRMKTLNTDLTDVNQMKVRSKLGLIDFWCHGFADIYLYLFIKISGMFC